jgi:nucleoside-diphosphate-sugar epimerase
LKPLLEQADQLFHTAAMAGLLKSWQQFDDYMTCNVLATQRLLAAAGRPARVGRFLHLLDLFGLWAFCDRRRDCPAGSGVSGTASPNWLPNSFATPMLPKMGCVSTILRLFSVYGPRQRPDVHGLHRIYLGELLAGERNHGRRRRH